MPERAHPENLSDADYPFREPLVESEVGGRDRNWIQEFENNPRFVVRINEVRDHESAVEIRAAFDELKQYGIRVPVRFVEAQAGATRRLYSVVDKITGSSPAAAQFEVGEKSMAREKFKRYFAGLFQYHFEKFKNKKPYLCDLTRASQFVYGTRPQTAEKDIYLVDIDYIISDDRFTMFGPKGLPKQISLMKLIEDKLDQPFLTARKILADFYTFAVDATATDPPDSSQKKSLTRFATAIKT